MQRKVMGIMIMVLALALTAPAEGDHNFNARTRVYGYVMGGNFHLTPAGSGLWDNLAYTEDAVAPTVGIGFSLLNINNRFFLNLEADATWASLDTGIYDTLNVTTISLMFQGEYRLGRMSPVSLYCGLGVGIIHNNGGNFPAGLEWLYVPEFTDTTLATELGVKVSITRHLMFRAAFRAFALVEDYYGEYGHYWDDYLGYWMDDYESELYATSVMAGLEFHF